MSQYNENSDKKNAGEKNHSQDPAELSLAELLGSSNDAVSDDAPKRVNYREDEPASGVVKLAGLVEAATVEMSKASPNDSFASGSYAFTGGQANSNGRITGAPIVTSTMPPPHRSRTAPIFIALGIVAVIVVFAVSMMNRQQSEKQAANLVEIAKLRAETEKELGRMREAEAARKLAEAAAISQAQHQETIVASANPNEAAKKVDEPAENEVAATSNNDAEKSPETQSEELPPPAKKKAGKSSTRTKRAHASSRPKPTQVASVATPQVKDSVVETPKTPVNDKTGELDALLSGSTKRPIPERASSSDSGGMPNIPTKSQVKAAMGPVAAKAKSCSRFSTGTVQLQVTVGNNGRVKESKALGSFANTTAGKCVEMMARTARFSKFSESAFTFTYPVILR